MGVFRSLKRRIKNKLIVKEPIYIPMLYGELLKGKTALVTGGTRGIGYAIAQAFINNGADVIITGRTQKGIEEACELLNAHSIKGRAYGAILNNIHTSQMYEGLESILRIAPKKRIDIFVNNAGIINKTTFGRTDETDFDIVLNTDLRGPYFLTELVSNYMIKNKIEGRILNITSSSALRPTTTSYGIAKWGMRGFTLGLAKQLSQYGIVVNALAPGPTLTQMLSGENLPNLNRPSSPSMRMSAPEEIANLAVILVSELGTMINGDTIYATGGCGNLTIDDWC